MNVELRKLKVNKAFSEETICFTADIVVDGKKVGTARNEGRGGMTFLHFDNPGSEQAFNAYCETIPPEPSGYDGLPPIPMTPDFFIDLLVEKTHELNWLKKTCKKKTVFIVEGDPKGQWSTVNITDSPETRQLIERKYKVAQYGNDLIANS